MANLPPLSSFSFGLFYGAEARSFLYGGHVLADSLLLSVHITAFDFLFFLRSSGSDSCQQVVQTPSSKIGCCPPSLPRTSTPPGLSPFFPERSSFTLVVFFFSLMRVGTIRVLLVALLDTTSAEFLPPSLSLLFPPSLRRKKVAGLFLPGANMSPELICTFALILPARYFKPDTENLPSTS